MLMFDSHFTAHVHLMCIFLLFTGLTSLQAKQTPPLQRMAHKFFPKSEKYPFRATVSDLGRVLSKRTLSGTGTISGTVVENDGITLYTGFAQISVLDTFGFELRNASSNYNGHFEISGLPAGTYTLMIDKINGDISFLGNTNKPSSAKWITLAEGQSSSGNTMVMPASSANGKEIEITISGTLIHESSPLPNTSGTIVAIQAENGYYHYISFFSGSDGSFSSKRQIIPGDYYLMIDPNNGFEPQWWDGTSVMTSQPKAVSLTTDISGKEIHLQTGASISGTIFKQNGETIDKDFYIELVGENGLIYKDTDLSSGDSTFSFRGIPSGSYYLKYSCYTNERYYRYYPNSETPSAATLFTFAKGQNIVGIDITVPNSSSPIVKKETAIISGTATYQNAPIDFDTRVKFFYQNPIGNWTSSSSVNSGFFSASINASEPFKVLMSPETHYYAMPTWYPNTTDETAAEYITIDPFDAENISIQVQSGGSAGCFLRDENGISTDFKALSSLELGYVFFIDGNSENSETPYTRLTPLNGLRFTGLEPGTHTAWACLLSEGTKGPEAMAGKQGYSPGTQLGPFTVAESITTVIPNSMNLKSGTIHLTVPYGQNALAACYDSHNRLVAFIMLDDHGRPTISRFFQPDRDYSLTSSVFSSTPVTIPFLSSGEYKLAIMSPGSNDYQANMQWYGMDQKITVDNIVIEENLFLYPDIPAQAKTITVTDGQITNVSFANTSINAKAKNITGGLSLYAQNRPACTISYSLGRSADKKCSISVFSVDGRCIKKWNLSSVKGTLSLGGRNKVPNGTYLVVLSNGVQQRTMRLPIMK